MTEEQRMQLEQDIKVLGEICSRYGWSLAIPSGDDESEIPGLILGTPEYIDFLLGDDVPLDQKN